VTRDEAAAAVGQPCTVRLADPYVGAVVIQDGTVAGLDGPDVVVDLAGGGRAHCSPGETTLGASGSSCRAHDLRET
jgi:hypothetical protein